jgi:hypothetical protein
LLEPQNAAGPGAVVGIEHPVERVGFFQRPAGVHLLAAPERVEVDRALRAGLPEPQRGDVRGVMRRHDEVVGARHQVLRRQPSAEVAFALHACAERDGVAGGGTRDLPRVAVAHPVVGLLHLLAVLDALREHAVAIAQPVAERGQADLGERVEEAGGQAAEAAVAECRVQLAFYYADYAEAPLSRLGRALAEGFIYQGEVSALRGKPHGEPSAQLPSVAFVAFLQSHDQVGNRAFGERIATLVDEAGAQRLESLRVALLLAPQVPLMFMGEEWDASTPVLHFCDFHGELADAVRQGRRQEFARFAAFADADARARIPDPNDAGTFAACVLKRAERDEPAHAARLAATRAVLETRQRHLVPRLLHRSLGGTHEEDAGLLQVHWVLGDGALWHLALNLRDEAVALPLVGELVHALRATDAAIGARGVRVSVEAVDGGARA